MAEHAATASDGGDIHDAAMGATLVAVLGLRRAVMAGDVPSASVLTEAMAALDGLRRVFEVADQVLSGAFADSMAWAADGARSVGSWLASHTEVARSVAADRCRTGQRLRSLPVTRQAGLDGRLGGARCRLLAATAADEGVRDLFLEHEDELVRTVEGLTVDGTRRYLASWTERAKAEAGVDSGDPGFDPDDVLRLSQTWRGRWRLDGSLGPVAGAALEAALDAEIERWRHDGLLADDRRTWSQLRAAALVSLLGRVGEPGGAGAEARPLVIALVDAGLLGPRSDRRRARPHDPGDAVDGRVGGGAENPDHRLDPPDRLDQPDRLDRGVVPGGDAPDRCRSDLVVGRRGAALPEGSLGDDSTEAVPRSAPPPDEGTGPPGGDGNAGVRHGPESEAANRTDRPAAEASGDRAAGEIYARCEVVGSGPIAPETVRRLLCAGDVCRVVVDGDSMPLDVGRRHRVATPHQRRAVIAAADGCCQWPGCDAPHRWCHVHHLHDWDDDGPTDIANLALICGHHHRLVHEGGFGLVRVDGRLVATDRAGREVTVPYRDRPRRRSA